MSVIFGVGAPGVIGAANGGKVYAFNDMSTTPQEVAPENPGRRSITFINPGAVDIYVAPALVQTSGSDVALTPSTGALGGCIHVFAAGGTWTITGECQGAWQAFSASGTGNPLTVIDTNIG